MKKEGRICLTVLTTVLLVLTIVFNLSLVNADVGSILSVGDENYSFSMHTLGVAGAKAQGSVYSARTLTTAFQSGNRNAQGTSFFANIGFFKNTTRTILNFSINSYTASPAVANKGDAVNLFISASLASLVWASITLPNSAVENLTLTNGADTPYTNTSLIGRYNVTFFAQNSSGSIVNASVYFTVIEPVVSPTPTTNLTTGGGSYQCIKNSDCEVGKSCFEHKCVKLFDIKILSVESPIKPSSFFNFVYYVKGMANINSDVVIEFWLEKDGKRFTAGQDTIYLGSFEEKTEKAQLFLPDEALKGVYYFYVKVYYSNYSALSYRVIQVNDKGDVKFVESGEEGFTFPSGIFSFILGIVIAVLFCGVVVLAFLVYKLYKRRQNYGY